jgi:hypothetical protein
MNIFAEQPDKMPLFGGIGRTWFAGFNMVPGSGLSAAEQAGRQDGKRNFSTSAHITDDNGRVIAEINDMQGLIVSKTLLKRALATD